MRTLIAVAVLAVGAAALTAQDDKKYEKDGKFTAKFPAAPTTLTKSAGGLTLNITISDYEKGKGGLMVIYSDIPADKAKAPTPDQILDSCKRGLEEEFKLKNAKIEPVKDAKRPTRTVEGERDEMFITGQIVLARNRLYQVYAFGPKEYTTGDVAKEFIKSFTITE